MKTVYLDHHSTTPLDPRALKAMMPYLGPKFGNAASGTHRFGREAFRAVETARAQVARLIAARPREIVFTSGATESNNLALKGAFASLRAGRRRVVTVVTEHKSVLDPFRRLELEGAEVVRLPVGPDGLVDPGEFARAMTDGTAFASVMLANNEIGVIQPVAELARLAH
ncbi:MAG TPA: aminotransferase class V-fold PLP-dependent enzyme, partial [Candidatus Eisenbacteria bacterium]|nr:aminotransferase class V-fold PLP-dependent enzyme [Candidatus Eisenbacteria bacterium]